MPQNIPVGIGVTGSGFMGRTHVEAAQRSPETRIVAVTGGSRSQQLAADYDIDWEPDTVSMVTRPDIDALVITTPHHVHMEEAMMAAEHGKHALVEKPLGTSLRDCDRMIREFSEKDRILALGYHQRFRKSNDTVRELIQSDAIGQVRCIQMSALFDIEALRADEGFGGAWNWWKDPRSKAHLLNSGPHNIDLCRWWLSSELQTVVAHCGTFREDNPNENTTMAMWTFTDGTVASFWSSSVLPSPGFEQEDFRFRIMGDKGIIDANPFGKIRVGRQGKWELTYEQPAVAFDDADLAFVSDGRMQAYTDQMSAFAERIFGNHSLCGTEQDGRAGVLAILAMLQSSHTGQLIHLSDETMVEPSVKG